MDSLLVAYLTFTAILVVTPGSTTAVVVRNALVGGRSAGLSAALGALVGNSSHATAAGLGLGLLVARWPLVLTILRFAGASYLAWLGVQSVYRALTRADGGLPIPTPDGVAAHGVRRHAFREGLTVTVLNPVIVTFYLVVVPSFLPERSSPGLFVLFAVFHIGISLISHSAWAMGLHTLRAWFRPPRARRVLEALTGAALLALAIRVLAR